MIGKKFPSDDQVLKRLRYLQTLVNSIQKTPILPISGEIVEDLSEDMIDIVDDYTDEYVLDEEDFGKTMTMNSADTKTFTLPAVTVAEIGRWVEFIKKGNGKLIIQTAGADKIDDSGAGGTLYNDLTQAEEYRPTVKIKVIAAGEWNIMNVKGEGWRTS